MLAKTIESNFNSLFKDLYSSLCNYAYSFLKDYDYSEDVVQSALIFLWEQKKELIGSDNAKYYLFTTVRNNCISHLRKFNRVDNLFDISALEDELYEDVVDEQRKVVSAKEIIEEAINGLPPKCAEVFKRCKIDKLTYREIALRMNISVKTVENHMGKAIKHMREFIKHKDVILFYIIVSFLIAIEYLL